MPKRRYGGKVTNVPGKGLTWTAYEDYDYDLVYPERRGVPRDPRARAMKAFVMRRAQELFKSHQVTSMAEALRQAWAEARRRY